MAPGADPAGNELMRKNVAAAIRVEMDSQDLGNLESHKKGILQFSAAFTRTMPIQSHVGWEVTTPGLIPTSVSFPSTCSWPAQVKPLSH